MVQVILPGTVEPSAFVRVRFRKTGALQYTAHLDLVRTLTKAINRAGIPVRYSEGFNPHPRFSFATAMSIGLESLYELMDIRIDRPVDPDALALALRESLTEECYIEEAYFAKTKFTDIAYSSYVARIFAPGASAALAKQCEDALRGREVVVFKRSKSGDKDTNIAPFIKEVACTYEDGAILLRTLLTADNAHFLNPEYLITYLKQTVGILQGNPMEERYELCRTGLYTKEMTLFR